MDLAVMRERLTDYLNDDSTQRWSEETRDAYINIAYKRFCNTDNWPFREALSTSITTVAGTQSYTLPQTINMPLGVWVTSIKEPNKLVPVTRKERDTFTFSGNGRPLFYFLFGPDSLQLYPTPDNAYPLLIEYQARIADLVLTTDEPIFDSDFHYLIPLLAASILKRTSGGSDDKEADGLYQEYLAGLEDAKFRMLPRELDRPKGVASLYDFGGYSPRIQSNF